ncbi:MAG: hypothetical protein K6C94_10080 [Candidatus Gastranaerophilales bacterium]|nr:hypothetical protein [Candidatus Gastranaerophilales bacterium]
MNIQSTNNLTSVSGVQNKPVSTRYISKTGVDTFVHSQDTTENPEKAASVNTEKQAYIPTKQFSETISTLTALQNQAENTFQKQLDSMGWCGKLADKASTVWGSKNRSKVVQEDLHQSRFEIENLQTAACKGNFKSEFFKTFGVNYDKEAIDNFQKTAENYQLIEASMQMAETSKKELGGYLEFFEKHADSINPESPNFDKTKKHPNIKAKMDSYKTDLEKYVGGKDNLDKLVTAKRRDFITLSREEQLDVYNEIAESLIYTYQETSNKLKNGKTDKEIQKEYDSAYEKAFGTKNNIQKRVTDYVKAQQIRTIAAEDMAISGLIGATVALTGTGAPALLGAGLSTVGYLGFDLSELATNNVDNKEDLNKETVKDLVKCSLISGAEYFAGSKLYDVIPEAKTGKRIFDTSLNVARTLGIELSTAFAGEYLRSGEWAIKQMDPKSFIGLTLSAFGTEELVRMGICSSKSFNNDYKPQSFKITEHTMEKISAAANNELQKQFTKNPAKFMNLKLLSIENPALFKEVLTKALSNNGSN